MKHSGENPGWGVPRELLLLLDGDPAAEQALAHVAAWGQVTSRLAPRLALVLLPAERLPDVRDLRGVVGVFAAELPAELAGSLGPQERLFVDGWLARGSAKPPRLDEGRSWDPPT